ncbi:MULTISPECIES: bifunctional protein-serine/threonine kinase/phosphatase [unclassified Pseudomonas]|jgi:serine/threonine protein phosphatase PrpC|uniref:bifunctional protein-serine/threonine kinase/phosphatase n=1 Tax=unclassified Pseudomonas TaxID=196821 RepID=UPI002A35CBEE|nr:MULTISPECIES: bifunctional protein-serine/threonine kinase/phosphatase [unclassified Pseudomonas]MDX9673768.1 bifunctional protein-serine/threonine kinase/phosphatase [Pseudomonas sp. P8_250]WPN37705.1 bifunctional protein-serine/threonine kinase/phosphatase [Pseudomonas sp. P8_139]WPN40492.1 bifunctional protein-serine/threonine kinase/phosphatase [Pseudomonas sp. P8_229]
MPLQLSFAEASATGPRAENQDALRLVTPAPALAASKGYLFAIADGVSQCADGGLAARSTLQALALDYYATPQTWSVAQALDRLLLAQNRWLQANGGGQPLLTTVSALVLRGQRFTLAHVGDCRVYRWQADHLLRISQDHVWDQPGMQHVLKRALGLDQHLVLDFLDGELRADECFVLLSDGVWSSLGDTAIAAILRDQPDLDSAAQTLVNAAHLAGSQDNASALLVRVDAVGEASIGDALIHLQQWPLPPPLKTGQVFEGWKVQGIVGQSQQSLLYRVMDGQGRGWLLKTLPARLADDPQAGQALLSEEWFLKRVAGRHFPEVHASSQRQHVYYVMREYSGKTLAQVFQHSSPLPLVQWQDLAERLLRAVGLLHRRQILHRDIKPENLHLGDDGELRLLDFGLAYCPGLSQDTPATLPGTPSFIAPEAFRGEPPSAQQDLYAVGVSLYFLLTGHFPYGEIEAFQRPRFGVPVSASRYRPDLPDWVAQSLERGVAADPQQRFETAEEWLLVLEQGERRSLSVRPRPLLEREPLKVWRTMALIALLGNLVLLILLFHR